MNMQIYSVRDNAVAAYLQPFFSPTTNAAIRALTEAVNDPKSQFHAHASDYSLWILGSFDDATGELHPCVAPERIISCVDLLNKN